LLLQNGAAALVIGAALALSSTAIVLQLLSSSDRLGSASGRACLAVLLFQDLMVVPILLLVDLLGRDTDGSFLVALGSALGIAVLVVAVIMLAGQRLARPMLRLAASARMPEAFTAAVLLLIIVIAAVTAEAGLSLALGAFLAGLLLAETEFRHEIEVTLAPFKGLLLGLFFMSVGMGLDLSLVARELYWLGPALIAMLALKMLLLLGLGRAFGLSWPANVEMSLPMAPAGEFAFIIATAAGALGVLEPETAQLVIVLAGASMLLTPALSALGRRAAIALEGKLQEGGFQPDEATDLSGHIVIVGYGRVGRFLGTVLSERGTPHLAIDSDPNLVAKRREETGSVIYGDGKKIEILRQLGLDRAAGLAVTMNDPEANERVVEAVREAWPKLPIFARAHDTAHARKLMRIGANRATSEALEAGLDLSEAVLTGIGVPRETARAGLDRFRRVELESL
jgi:CPA2 family monovalent cation:H+ antiporter-2